MFAPGLLISGLQTTTMELLSKRHQSLCSNLGTFGILISLTCLIQQLVFGTNHWLALVMPVIYLFVAISFLLLTLQKTAAPILLIISAALTFIAEIILMMSLAFSPVVLLLFFYSIIAVVVIYMENVPKKLKEKAQALKMEELAWRDKI